MKAKAQMYNNKTIYYFKDDDLGIAKGIIDKKYKVLKTLKESKRNYVAVINVNNREMLLKEPRNEHRMMQRYLLTPFKRGEALSTLENLNTLIYEKNIDEYAKIYAAIIERKHGFIIYSCILMEYCGDDNLSNYYKTDKEKMYKDMIMAAAKKIHSAGVYHGDMTRWNFAIQDGKIRIFDTVGKKMLFGNYRAHYDMLTYQSANYKDMEYPYPKNIWYYLALFMKKIKRSKIMSFMSEYRKKRREKRA